MAYNPNLYSPNYYNSPVPYQQVVSPMQMQPTPPMMDNSILWVNGEKDALAFALAPNKAVALWDATAPVIYLKQSDASGRPTMRTYDLIERTSEVQETAKEYATKDELTAVASTVKSFGDALGGIKCEIEKMSGDLYGIAGKKKAKKQEQEEDDS